MSTRDYWLAFGSGLPSTYSGLAPTFIIFVNGSGATITPPSITETYSGTGLYKFAYDATQTISFVVDGATTGLATTDRYIVGVLDAQDTFGVTLNAIGSTQTALGATLVSIGTTGIAIGLSNIALGTTGVAIGLSNIALGTTGVAIGLSNIALGTTAVALGTSGIALGTTAVALGTSNIALGTTSVALGITINAIGVSLYSLGQTGSALIGDTSSSFGTDSVDPTTVFGFLKRAQDLSEGDETYTKATGVLTMSSRGASQLLATKTIADSSTQTTKT